MKLYPCNHNIYNVDKVDDNQDIVIGYLDSGFVENNISANIENDFSSSFKKEILPYQKINTLDIALFDKNGNVISEEIKSRVLTREDGGNYIYKPSNSLTYTPLQFEYSVLAKKKIRYSSSRHYNIAVGCSEKELAENMIQYFSDSYKRKTCPTNIKFNNGDVKLESLLDGAINEKDFMFLRASDGITLKNGDKIDIDSYISNGSIPWIICDEMPGVVNNADENIGFDIIKNQVINTKQFNTSFYFNNPIADDNEIIHNLFGPSIEYSPIVVKEIVDKGFVVYCTSEFIARLSTTYDILYEVMMFVYMNAYISTPILTEWIADEMPNYVVQNERLVQKEKFTSHMELYKILNLLDGDVSAVNVKIKPPSGAISPIVYFVGMSNSYLVFKKIKSDEYADPVKGENQISIYTERKNIIYFDDFIYKVQEDITNKITYKIENNALDVTIDQFKNTDLNSTGGWDSIKVQLDLDSNKIKQYAYLVWSKNNRTARITNAMIPEELLLCTLIIVKEKENSKLFDMRRRGGGLPEGIDNYNCLDIGNILGRPYRKGGTLITTLNIPLKYEYMKDKIKLIVEEAINKSKSAGDYLVLNIEFE